MDQAWRILDPTAPKPVQDRQLAINRRQFFGRGATGIGTAALAGLLGRDGLLAGAIIQARRSAWRFSPSRQGQARHLPFSERSAHPLLISIRLQASPAQVARQTPVPEEYLGGKRFSTMTGNPQAGNSCWNRWNLFSNTVILVPG